MTLTLGEQAEKALKIVEEAPLMAYDTESSGLDWKKNQPVGYVITESRENNFYIPVRHGGGNNLLDPSVPPMREPDSSSSQHKFEKALAKAFKRRAERGFRTVGHNLKFDMHFSANQGVIVGRNCYDTSITEPMLDEFSRSFSLDGCAKNHGVTAKKGEELYQHLANQFGGIVDRKQMENYWRLAGNDPIGVDYALGDGITTLELHHAQMAQIIEEEMEYIHDIESRLVYTVFKMERCGIRVDVSMLEQTIKDMEEQIEKARSALPRGFNPRSPLQMKKFMEETGHTDWPTTVPVGNPSFPEKWLKTHPEGRAVVTLRQMTNLMNSFILPLEDTHIHKGRVYSSFNQLKSDEYGTISGRFSSSQPNMQQVPKRNKELGRIFRRLFIPDEGKTFVEADYSQCEPRLFAHYSKESSLLDGYNSSPPRDMHAVVADLLDVERDPTAKRMNMGILTGMQKESFAGHMGWDIDKATRAFNEWFDVFPGIKKFQNTAKGIFRNTRYVRTILGRRCRLDNPRFAYRAVSRIIQGSNADILKERMLALDIYMEQEWPETDLFLTVHDSLGWQSPDDQVEKSNPLFVELLCRVQQDPYNLRVPFVMDVGSGKNWAVATWGPE